MSYGLLTGGNAYSKTRDPYLDPQYITMPVPSQEYAPTTTTVIDPGYQRGDRVWQDPFGINKNRTMGAMFNPIGEAILQKSPAPLLDPFGYAGGMYKPGSTGGKMMNKADPFKIFTGGLLNW